MSSTDTKYLLASVIYLSTNGKPHSDEWLRYKLKDDLGIQAKIVSASERISLAVTDDEQSPSATLIKYEESVFRVNIDFTIDRRQDISQIIFRFCNPVEDDKRLWQAWLLLQKNVFKEEIVAAHKDVEVRPFSFGSLVGMNSFVEHYSSHWSSERTFGIGKVTANFLHDLKKLLITIPVIERKKSGNRRSREQSEMFKIEILYTSILRILVQYVPEPQNKGRNFRFYNVYLQLAGAPFLFERKRDKDGDEDESEEVFRNKILEDEYKAPHKQTLPWIRAVSFGNENEIVHCSKNVIGLSRVLKLTLADSAEHKAWDVISQLSACCKFAQVYFSPAMVVECKKPFQSPSIPKSFFHGLYGLKCVLTCGYDVSDQLHLNKSLLEVNKLLKEYAEEDERALENAFYDIHRMLNQAEVLRFKEAVIDLFRKYSEKNKRGLNSVYCLTTVKDDVENIRVENAEDTKSQSKQNGIGLTANQGIGIPLFRKKKPTDMIILRRAFLTPTRLLFLPPLPQMMSFLLRSCDPEYAMRLTLRDDDYDQLTFKLKGSDDQKDQFLHDNFLNVMVKGIQIGNRQYQFFGSSTSQLREHGLLLYAKDCKNRSAEGIRNTLGKLSEIPSVPKYLARMGQSLSQAMTSVEVERKYCGPKQPDITRSGYNFTDGVGKISPELMEEVYKKLKLRKGQKPSAIQVRYGGCKGMLTLDDTLQGKKVLFRESQWKYDSDSTSLEILKFSEPRQVYLNRPFITILEQMGVPPEVFINLQSKTIESLIKSLFRSDEATNLLQEKALMRLPYERLNKAGFDLSLEPFFRTMVMALYRSSIETLKHKARILIPFSEGRTMFGVVDETGTLEYGQIFVQYTEEMEDDRVTNKTHVLEGTVLVTKNPCMHPGDVRKFKAVDVKALHHIRDCLVFPSKGRRPHPDEMAGSDLDGDEYCVIWHEALYFKRNNHEAMDYSNPDSLKVDSDRVFSENDTDKERIQKMGKFFCYYIRSDAVGLIASAHLAWADRESIMTEKCMSIAKKFSVTLDFAKSGEPAELTHAERVKRYPDFMEKFSNKKTYLSTRALGELYRNCRMIDLASRVLGSEVEVELDRDLIVDGFEAYKKGAKKAFENFKNSMEEPCKMFCITNEGELMSGAIVSQDKFLKGRNTNENMDMSLNCYIPNVFKIMREKFFEEFRSHPSVINLCLYYMRGEIPVMREMNPPLALYLFIQRWSRGLDIDAELENAHGLKDVLNKVFKKASAWYQVAYQAKKDGTSIFLGLPWTISEVLILMKKKVLSVGGSAMPTFEERLQAFIKEERGKICTFLGVTQKDPDLRIAEALMKKWLRYHARTIALRSGHHDDLDREFRTIFGTCVGNNEGIMAAKILLKVLFTMAQFSFTTVRWEAKPNVNVKTVIIRKELGLLAVMALANLSSTGRLWGKNDELSEKNIFGCSFLDEKYREELHMSLDVKKVYRENRKEDVLSTDEKFVDFIKKRENDVRDLLRRWSGVDEVLIEFKETAERSDKWFVLLSILGKRLRIEFLKDILIGENFRANVVSAIEQDI